MTTRMIRPRRSPLAVRLSTFGVVAALLALALVPASYADPLNPFRTFTDSGVVSPEERARREEVRTELYQRYSADYQVNVPFVSEASVTALEAAIQRYQGIVQSGGWPVITEKVTLRPGDTDQAIANIRRRMMIEGDLPAGSSASPVFDEEFLAGLARFQVRNGLRVSGFVDSQTAAVLGISAEERLKQLETNLE